LLRESELRFRTLIEQTTDAVFCYEFDTPIPIDVPIDEQVKRMYNCVLIECNDVCAKSYGAESGKDVIGSKLTDLFGTTPDSLDHLFRELIQGDYRIVDGEGIEILPDGTRRYFLNNGHGVVEDGKLIRVWGTFRDITDRRLTEKALIESEEKLKAQYHNIPIPTYTWKRIGDDFVLEDYNDADMKITEGEIPDFIGTKASEMYRDMPEIQEKMMECLIKKTSIETEMFYRLFTTNQEKHLNVKFAFVPPAFVMIHTEDITDRKTY
jgi:PAS domain-containing protein